jgi:hypothetical protein
MNLPLLSRLTNLETLNIRGKSGIRGNFGDIQSLKNLQKLVTYTINVDLQKIPTKILKLVLWDSIQPGTDPFVSFSQTLLSWKSTILGNCTWNLTAWSHKNLQSLTILGRVQISEIPELPNLVDLKLLNGGDIHEGNTNLQFLNWGSPAGRNLNFLTNCQNLQNLCCLNCLKKF